jgi:hypothetical protein
MILILLDISSISPVRFSVHDDYTAIECLIYEIFARTMVYLRIFSSLMLLVNKTSPIEGETIVNLIS